MVILSKKRIIEFKEKIERLLYKRDNILDSMYNAELGLNFSEWDNLYDKLLEVESEIESYENILNNYETWKR